VNEQESNLESGLRYAMAFAAFGLFMLAIMAPKYESRQTKLENQYRGIQEMQRTAGSERAGQDVDEQTEEAGGGSRSVPTVGGIELLRQDETERLIRRKPLYYVLGTIMLGTWLVLIWRRSRRIAALREVTRSERDGNKSTTS